MIELRYCVPGNHDFSVDLDNLENECHTDEASGGDVCWDHDKECNPRAETNLIVDWIRSLNPAHYTGESK